ncbi:MAG: double-strand break repair protein AddB [Rhizobiaceae bacterium]|nr:double-strand break repair protein AddB [Rhizobiaceae bacterium]
MPAPLAPRVYSIPPGVPFLPTLADALLSGRLVAGFPSGDDPAALADATIFVPTRRAARALRSVFAERLGARAAILPVVRPLGEFDEDAAAFEETSVDTLALAPPVSATERLLMLAPLVRRWKQRLPAHVAQLFAEEVVVPASAADALWLARDLAALIDEVDTEGADWTKLGGLVDASLSGWWQVTLDFLEIVTRAWPEALKELDRSNPAAHRSALIRAEAARLARNPPPGPVIAAGSTGSIPATAELMATIARLPTGAVVLPGLDAGLDAQSLQALSAEAPEPQLQGHPQFGLLRLLRRLDIAREAVADLGEPSAAMQSRRAILSEAMRPAETSDAWVERRALFAEPAIAQALQGVTLVEAANEREEALAAALALRRAVDVPGRRAALVTPDRPLARRVSAELLRFGIRADDSGGAPLLQTPPAELLTLLVETALKPGAPVPIAALLKHPLLHLGLERQAVRRAAEAAELVTLRGSPARPDAAAMVPLFDRRLAAITAEGARRPFWLGRVAAAECRAMLGRLSDAVAPLAALRDTADLTLAEALAVTVQSLEALGRAADGGLSALYAGDAGERLADALRALAGTTAPFSFPGADWPDVLRALLAPEAVKPRAGGEGRVAIWGTLEARLQDVDTLVIAGLNEGSWPRRAEADRFMSRMMKGGLDLAPPERRIGQAAHDFTMGLGTPEVVMTRAVRAGDAPAPPSRWLQRLTTFLGADATAPMRRRGADLVMLARALDMPERRFGFKRPSPTPPPAVRPRNFSVTEIEMLRRDPYAVYARRILGLSKLDPMVRDPGAAERGTLFHEILKRFTQACPDPTVRNAPQMLLSAAHAVFREAALPADVEAVWWPRFVALASSPSGYLAWERERVERVKERHAEVRAVPSRVGRTGVTLSGYADRVDILFGGMGAVLDYKTGSSPSKAQAHTLIAPQLALEAALLARGAFEALGKVVPSELSYVRLRPNGMVEEETILDVQGRPAKSAPQLAEEAWRRLEELLAAYREPERGYTSRALPFREGDTDGDYDHLARVLEWSAGGDGEELMSE